MARKQGLWGGRSHPSLQSQQQQLGGRGPGPALQRAKQRGRGGLLPEGQPVRSLQPRGGRWGALPPVCMVGACVRDGVCVFLPDLVGVVEWWVNGGMGLVNSHLFVLLLDEEAGKRPAWWPVGGTRSCRPSSRRRHQQQQQRRQRSSPGSHRRRTKAVPREEVEGLYSGWPAW